MKNNKTIQRIYNMIKPHIKSIIIITLISLIINLGEIAKPYIIEIVIDNYLSQGIWQKGIFTIGTIGAIYIGVVIFQNILDFIAKTATNMLGENVIYDLRNKLFKHVQYSNISFHDKTPAGTLFVRITNDIEDVTTFFKDVVTGSLRDIILIFVILGIMIYMSIQLTMVSIIIVPLIIISSVIITKVLNNIYEKSKVIRTKVNVFLAESIYGIKVIKIFNRQKEKQLECEDLNKKFRDSRNPTGILEGLLPAIMTVIENLGIALVVWACMKNWFGINVEIGVLYMFITYIKKIFEPITNIIENVEIVQEAIVSINKVYEILEKEEYLENFHEGQELQEIKGKIEFKDVWFTYDKPECENPTWVLKGINFTIEPGQSIALVGKTGSGKTTITNLINRFYEIQKGEILIDGINIKDINIRSLREKVGTVLQDPFIFATDIRNNVKLNSNNSDDDVYTALELASANEFVNSLPNRMYEVAKERGSSFSAGQKQLIAFARIFAHNPSIFILDEATANIDTKTEQLIQKSVDMISAKKTSIFIAHRLSTIINVDKIIVLDNGEIIEIGNHSELLQTNGYYSKLYNSYYESLSNA